MYLYSPNETQALTRHCRAINPPWVPGSVQFSKSAVRKVRTGLDRGSLELTHGALLVTKLAVLASIWALVVDFLFKVPVESLQAPVYHSRTEMLGNPQQADLLPPLSFASSYSYPTTLTQGKAALGLSCVWGSHHGPPFLVWHLLQFCVRATWHHYSLTLNWN